MTALHSLDGQFVEGDRDVEVLCRNGRSLPIHTVPMFQTFDVQRAVDMGLPRIGGCLTIDRAVFEHTALYYDGYADEPSLHGDLYIPEEKIRSFPREDCRHRVEHYFTPTEAAVAGAGRLGLAVTLQPIFSYLWEAERVCFLGEERSNRTYPFKRLCDLGYVVAVGSDSPVTEISPLLGVQGAVNQPEPDAQGLRRGCATHVYDQRRVGGF